MNDVLTQIATAVRVWTSRTRYIVPDDDESLAVISKSILDKYTALQPDNDMSNMTVDEWVQIIDDEDVLSIVDVDVVFYSHNSHLMLKRSRKSIYYIEIAFLYMKDMFLNDSRYSCIRSIISTSTTSNRTYSRLTGYSRQTDLRE